VVPYDAERRLGSNSDPDQEFAIIFKKCLKSRLTGIFSNILRRTKELCESRHPISREGCFGAAGSREKPPGAEPRHGTDLHRSLEILSNAHRRYPETFARIALVGVEQEFTSRKILTRSGRLAIARHP
jgi:hypothetical protein